MIVFFYYVYLFFACTKYTSDINKKTKTKTKKGQTTVSPVLLMRAAVSSLAAERPRRCESINHVLIIGALPAHNEKVKRPIILRL